LLFLFKLFFTLFIIFDSLKDSERLISHADHVVIFNDLQNSRERSASWEYLTRIPVTCGIVANVGALPCKGASRNSENTKRKANAISLHYISLLSSPLQLLPGQGVISQQFIDDLSA